MMISAPRVRMPGPAWSLSTMQKYKAFLRAREFESLAFVHCEHASEAVTNHLRDAKAFFAA